MSYLKEIADGGYSSGNIDDYHKFMVPFLMASNDIKLNHSIIDIGSASGHYLIPLYEKGFRQLTAVDIDDYNFELFKTQYNISCHKIDIEHENLPLEDNSVDCVLAVHLIEHLHRPDCLMREAYRVLKSQGKLVLITPDWKKQIKIFWRDHTHVHPYDKIALKRLALAQGFKIVRIDSDGSRWGIHRMKIYRLLPWIGRIIGRDILLVGSKP